MHHFRHALGMKTILITGGSSGIGEALALGYAQPGARLILTGRNQERLADVAKACQGKGADTHTALIDVADRAAMCDMIERFDDQFSIDLAIANAGISAGTGGTSFHESLRQADTIFDININGVLNTIHPLLPRMMAREHGQVALVSSLAGFMALAGAPAYSASKAFVRYYGEGLRGQCAEKGVKVSVICPGFVRSRMTATNKYPMPFLMDTDKAARIIINALDQNQGRIAFPWPMYLVAGMMGLLPPWLSEMISRRAPQKSALPTAPL